MKNVRHILLTAIILMICHTIYIEAQCLMADSLLIQQDYLGAADYYHDCLTTDSTNMDIRSKYAGSLFFAGIYHEARYEYHILESDPKYHAEAAERLAHIYESQQNLPKAIKYYRALHELYPNNTTYLRKLGSMYQQGNEMLQSIDSYQKALTVNPQDVLCIQAYAELMHKLNELQVCDSLCKYGLGLDSIHIGLSLLYARTKFRMRDYAATAKMLLKMNTLTDLNNYHHKILGYSLIQIDSIDKAIFHLQRSLLDESSPEYALYYLGIAYEKKLDFEVSNYYYSEALKAAISENIVNYHRGLARNNAQLNALGSAIKHYTEALKYSEDPEILFYLASLSERHYKDNSKAINWYKKYIANKEANPDNKEIAKKRIRLLKEKKFMQSGSDN